ncbi:MAG: stage III sporulation protein AG [Clostridiales bacterium]|nr:stage III sporulation protein AG [Clostridiales bacterium]
MGKVRWSELWKKYKFVLLVVLVGIILMLLPVSSQTKETEENKSQIPQESFDLAAMEQRMEEVLGKIDGVGKLRLMLTLQSGTRLTLAEDTQRDQDRTQREIVTLNRGSGNQEIVITNRFYPVYQGAVVVCQGADSSAVRLAITETVQALTGLPSDRIRVAKWTS